MTGRRRKACLAALAVAACTADPAPRSTAGTPPLPIAVDELQVDLVLPGTRAHVRGSGFLDEASATATLTGRVGGAEAVLALPAERVDDQTLAVTFPPEAIRPLGEGTLRGVLRVEVALGEARGAAEAEVAVEVRQSLTPSVDAIPSGAFPSSPFELRGSGFIRGDEGTTFVELRGRYVRERDGAADDLAVAAVPTAAPATAGRWRRDVVAFDFDPAWVGIAPGSVEGELRVVNEGRGWSRASDWRPARFDLLPPVVHTVEPLAASRGQRIVITGQGFVGGDDGNGYTALRLDGVFHGEDGEVTAIPPGGLELVPIRIDGTTLAFSMRPHFDPDCRSRDLGARPGRLEGTVTPITGWGDETVEGASTPLTFDVLPTKQVVWLRFLPAFTDSLRLFGLRNVSGEVTARIIEVVRRDYDGINLEVRLTEPDDFLEYSIVEIGGPDPNAQQLFGLDNTAGLDRCNRRLDDYLAGRNADSNGAYGGIFVESFLQLSPSRGTDNPLAHPAFDDIFLPVMDEPVEPGEYPGGPRDAVVERAIRTLGNLVGNTVTHEIGHSLGLPVAPGCGQYHNAPGPLQIMDCGADRPFEERAELDGHPPARWTPENRDYLERILPLR